MIIDRLAVVGVGLIGGSFAMALRQAGVVGSVVGIDANRDNLLVARSRGIVDDIAEDLCSGVTDADVVFVATPVCTIADLVRDMVPGLKSGAIVTDGGSVKGSLVERCESVLPSGYHFVGGHPIAGTEHSGAAAAFPDLFRGKRCVLTPGDTTDPHALATVSRLWTAAGAAVCAMETGHHDRIFAEISHLPHAIAYTLVHAVGTADVEGENVLSYTAGGFRDFTRIASSDPVMWRDIALMNRAALLSSIDGFSASLAELRRRIDGNDHDGLTEFFTTAKKFRDGIL